MGAQTDAIDRVDRIDRMDRIERISVAVRNGLTRANSNEAGLEAQPTGEKSVYLRFVSKGPICRGKGLSLGAGLAIGQCQPAAKADAPAVFARLSGHAQIIPHRIVSHCSPILAQGLYDKDRKSVV